MSPQAPAPPCGAAQGPAADPGLERVAGAPAPGMPPPAPSALGTLPAEPGVYLFRDGTGEILYVGKAKSLRRRVRSYFRADGRLPPRTGALVRRVRQVEARVVRTEREALVLEAILIRAHRPKYNRRLKDGRGHPFLGITLHGPTPRVLLTERALDDGAAYFGPCPDAGAVRDALGVIRRLYTLRAETFEARHGAPRRAADQRRMVSELLALLDGRSPAARDRVDRAMREAAGALDFERAARLRKALAAVETLSRSPRARPGGPARRPEVVACVTVTLAERGPAA